jgi:methyl-accepting chemotaxis protein
MDEVTQQNAALVEQAAAAAESLVEQASSLMETVGAFKLAGGNSQTYSNYASANVSKPKAQSAAKRTPERRAPNSPLRNNTQASKPAAPKTGTNDAGDWEEF